METPLLTIPKTYTDKVTLHAYGEGALDAISKPRDSYTPHVKWFVRYARETGGGVDLETIRQYYLWLNNSGFSASTVRVRRQAVKRRVIDLFQDHTDEEQTYLRTKLDQLDRSAETKCPGSQQHRVGDYEIVAPAEYHTLLRGCRSDRQRRFIEFLYMTGARCGEMCKVRLSDCRLEDRIVTICLHGKGNRTMKEKRRDVYITRPMYEDIGNTFNGK